MLIKERIEKDLKSALLGGDKQLATTLRGLKSALLYAEVESGKRETGLGEEETINILRKEAKKRQESADLYKKGGNQQKADEELAEKQSIEKYLPQQISDEDLEKAVDKSIAEVGDNSIKSMGKIISATKEKVGGGADGGRIAAVVKQKVNNI